MCQIRDGIRVAFTIQGKHEAGDDDDEVLIQILKQDWSLDYKKISAKLSALKAAKYEKLGSKMRPTSYTACPKPTFDIDLTKLPNQ